jgi:hypothetical protein
MLARFPCIADTSMQDCQEFFKLLLNKLEDIFKRSSNQVVKLELSTVLVGRLHLNFLHSRVPQLHSAPAISLQTKV